MSAVIRILGVIVLAVGLFGAFMMIGTNTSAGITTGLSAVIGGSLLLGFGELLERVQNIEMHLIGKKETIDEKILNADEFYVRSKRFEVFEPEQKYDFLRLGGSGYIRARVLKTYTVPNGDRYRFQLPDREPVVLTKENTYIDDCDLFEHHGVLFVKLSALGLEPTVGENTVQLEYQ